MYAPKTHLRQQCTFDDVTVIIVARGEHARPPYKSLEGARVNTLQKRCHPQPLPVYLPPTPAPSSFTYAHTYLHHMVRVERTS